MPNIIEVKDKKNVYMNDPMLKAPRVQIEWTAEDMEEYRKCSEDVIYFIENYMKIINLDRGLVPFEMYDYQKELLKIYTTERYAISKWSRQSGKCSDFSTVINIRNKRTNEVQKMTIGEFYEARKKENDEKYL
jgi:hypothetical protein